MSTADTTFAALVTAIMADLAADVPGVATVIGRRAASAHNAPPMVGWWFATETPEGARKNAFPSGRRELYSTKVTLVVRCWATAATPSYTYAATDLEALLLLREAVVGCVHRAIPGAYVWAGAQYVTELSASDLGESADLAITLRLGVLDRAPTRATVTTAPLDPPAGATGDGALSPGETA
jgi:hypothetical protein